MAFRRKIIDEYNDEEVELTKEEISLIRRMMDSKAPHADFDPYPVRDILVLWSNLLVLYLGICYSHFNWLCMFCWSWNLIILCLALQSYIDWFTWDGAKHPLSNAPEPKRRFIPSKWDAKKVCGCMLVSSTTTYLLWSCGDLLLSILSSVMLLSWFEQTDAVNIF